MSFGFSLGRDVYSAGKKTAQKTAFGIVLLFFAAISLVATFFCAQFLSRNYRTIPEMLAWRLGAMLALVAALVIGFFPLGTIFSIIADVAGPTLGYDPSISIRAIPSTFLQFETGIEHVYRIALGIDGPIARYQYEDEGLSVSMKWIAILFVFLLGLEKGFVQRKKRRLAWDAERHNETFMRNAGLTEVADGIIVDSEGNRFRFESATPGRMELFAIGRRNKRGYLLHDENGKISEWTGLVSK